MARNYNQNDDRAKAIALANTQEQGPRLPMPSGAFSGELGLSLPKWKLLTDTVYPSAKSVDGILQAVAYCKERNLDVFKRPVHVVPMWNSALNREVETVWPGIGELRTTAVRTGQWAGTDEVVFGPSRSQPFKDKVKRGRGDNAYVAEEACDAFEFPLWAQLTVWKIVAGTRVAFVGPKVLFSEAFSGVGGMRVPNSMWRQRPFGQLEKCAEAAALRRAFPEELGNVYAAEEMEGKVMAGHNSRGADMDADVQVRDRGAPTRSSMAANVEPDDDADAAAEREEEARRKRAAAELRANHEAFTAATKVGIQGTKTIDRVEKAWAADREHIEQNLPHDLRDEVLSFYAEARARLAPAPAATIVLTDDQIAAYKVQLLARIADVADVDKLVALEDGEQGNLDLLPLSDREEMFAALDARKDGFMQSAGDGAAASSAGTDQQQEDE